ncbi:hypothetical protein ACJX0J_034668, partial [Zea mays]
MNTNIASKCAANIELIALILMLVQKLEGAKGKIAQKREMKMNTAMISMVQGSVDEKQIEQEMFGGGLLEDLDVCSGGYGTKIQQESKFKSQTMKKMKRKATSKKVFDRLEALAGTQESSIFSGLQEVLIVPLRAILILFLAMILLKWRWLDFMDLDPGKREKKKEL